jgi:hypothetical protein
MKTWVAIVLCLAALTAARAQTQTVWRCGADGRSYSASPCPEEGRALQLADDRSERQRMEAARVADSEAALARRLAEERREREKEWAARGPGLIAVGPVSAPEKSEAVRPPKRQAGKKQGPKRPPAFEARGTSPSTAQVSRRKPG